MIRRRARGSSADQAPDEHLPMLSVAQARTLTEIATEAFRSNGIDVTSLGDGQLTTPNGEHFGLHNLATQAARSNPGEWPELAGNHAATLAQARKTQDAGAPIGPDQIYLKLRPVADLQAEPGYPMDSPFPGVLAPLVADYPSHIAEMFNLDQVSHLGALDLLRRIARTNLARLPVPEIDRVVSDPNVPNSVVHILSGDDFFVAARALVLDDLMHKAGLGSGAAHGYLVAVPNRHSLAVHVLAGVGVVRASQFMAWYAQENCENSPGPISPELFYLAPDGQGQQVTDCVNTPNSLMVVGPLADAFRQLGLIE